MSDAVIAQKPSSTLADARASLDGRRRGIAALLPFLGPAVIASVAYIDPGNIATDVQGGAQFGYRLLWVVVFASLTAMFVQALSAKVGIATGRNLAELCRDHFGAPAAYALWVVAEIGAMATDVAEFVGAAVGFYLLLRVPLLWGAGLAAVAVIALLALERRGFRRLEAAMASFVVIIGAAYVFELIVAHPTGWVSGGAFAVTLPQGAMYLAVGIIGATIMPHVVFLHSSLTQNRIKPSSEADAKHIYRFEVMDVVIALGAAGIINVAMLVVAAAAFHSSGHADVATIGQAYQMLTPALGSAAAAAFAIALLASGLSSSAVGTMSGQVIMQGFVRFSIPIWVRRAVTMVPSFIVIGLSQNPQAVLIFTQVVLSFVLPFALVPLALLTARKDVMGGLVNSRATTATAWLIVALIIAFNVVLIGAQFTAR